MRPKYLLVMLALGLLSARAALAQETVSDYKQIHNLEWFKVYIVGVGSGFAWANYQLQQEQKDPLYCQPSNLALGQPNYVQILDLAVQHLPPGTAPETRLENLLFSSLVGMFPCSQRHVPEVSPPPKPLRFQPATLGYGDEEEVTPGCVGVLDITIHFSWEDPMNCWSGPEVDAPFSGVESVAYDIWDNGAALTIRLRQIKRPLLLGISTIAAIKVYRQIRKHSASTLQSCVLGTLDQRFNASRTAIACDKWAAE